ncbi:MAG: protein phosphatase 2C domain-containing protein [Hyphomonas sp.]|nr:protein phosphatase 2C domain-containing protein [Hyphomonas sp.]
MRLDVVSTVNDPGVPGKTGDDRAGFDAAAGTAWVLDGATDVTDLRPFPACESGAAWIAEALSDRLMQAPQSGEAPEAYFASVLADVRQRAEAESQIPLDKLPGEALPIASGIWMWLQGEEAVFVFMGDCMALIRSGAGVRLIGHAEKAEDETAAARRVMALTQEERMGWLRQSRRLSNEVGSAFGLGPAVAGNLHIERTALKPGDDICLMSDGLYRLISPYATHDLESLMADLSEKGLLALVRMLRDFENAPDGDIPRIKRRDDASAVYVRLLAAV